MISDRIVAAAIGAVSALLVILVKDLIIELLTQRKERRKQLVTQRIEKAYAPLDYLLYVFETNHREKETARKEIGTILKQYGYLLTDKMLSGLYILLDEECGETSKSDTSKRFIEEYQQLRADFYRIYADAQDISTGKL